MYWEHCTAIERDAWLDHHGDEVHRELPDQLAYSQLKYHLESTKKITHHRVPSRPINYSIHASEYYDARIVA